jgi:tetratricopeptide (TPR) repeat protein
MSAFLPGIDAAQRRSMKKLKDAAVGFEGGKQFEEAHEKYEALLVKQEEVFGEGHSETMETKLSILRVLDEKINKRGNEGGNFVDAANTANALRLEGRFEESLQLHEQAVERLTKTKGPDHSDTLSAMNNMGLAMIEQPRYLEKGLRVLKNVLEKRLILLNEDHLDTLITMHNVGNALLKLKRYEESRQTFEELVEKGSISLGDFHQDTLSSMHQLAVTLGYFIRYEEALPMFEVVVEKRSSKFGESHPYGCVHCFAPDLRPWP